MNIYQQKIATYVPVVETNWGGADSSCCIQTVMIDLEVGYFDVEKV